MVTGSGGDEKRRKKKKKESYNRGRRKYGVTCSFFILILDFDLGKRERRIEGKNEWFLGFDLEKKIKQMVI